MMLQQSIVEWLDTTPLSQRCAGIGLLTDALVAERLTNSERVQVEAALLIALDDPAPKVRIEIAKRLCRSALAPRGLILALAEDIDAVAVDVVRYSQLLSTGDLVRLVQRGTPAVQSAIADRDRLDALVQEAIIVDGAEEASSILLANQRTRLDAVVLRRAAHRFRDVGHIRDSILRRSETPVDARHSLLTALGETFGRSEFVRNILGEARADRLEADAADVAFGTLIDQVDSSELPAFVNHLRTDRHLTPALLVRMACSGRMDLFAASICQITQVGEKRVRKVMTDAREPTFRALMLSAGVPASLVPLLLSAVRAWKEISQASKIAPKDMMTEAMERITASHEQRHGQARLDALGNLLRNLSAEARALAISKDLERRRAA